VASPLAEPLSCGAAKMVVQPKVVSREFSGVVPHHLNVRSVVHGKAVQKIRIVPLVREHVEHETRNLVPPWVALVVRPGLVAPFLTETGGMADAAEMVDVEGRSGDDRGEFVTSA